MKLEKDLSLAEMGGVRVLINGLHCVGCVLQYVVSSFPGLPYFYFPFVLTIIHGSRRLAKNGEGLGAFIT